MPGSFIPLLFFRLAMRNNLDLVILYIFFRDATRKSARRVTQSYNRVTVSLKDLLFEEGITFFSLPLQSYLFFSIYECVDIRLVIPHDIFPRLI